MAEDTAHTAPTPTRMLSARELGPSENSAGDVARLGVDAEDPAPSTVPDEDPYGPVADTDCLRFAG